ncbi:unnamed protein product [Mortierella alpina]
MEHSSLRAHPWSSSVQARIVQSEDGSGSILHYRQTDLSASPPHAALLSCAHESQRLKKALPSLPSFRPSRFPRIFPPPTFSLFLSLSFSLTCNSCKHSLFLPTQ